MNPRKKKSVKDRQSRLLFQLEFSSFEEEIFKRILGKAIDFENFILRHQQRFFLKLYTYYNLQFFSIAVVEDSFDWKVAESAAQLGFWPDLISTDLHSGNVHGGTTMDLCFYIRCGLSASQVLCHCDFIISLRIHDLCNFFFLHSKRSINILNSIFSSRFSLDFNTDLCRRKKLDISCFYGQSVSKVFGTFPF